MNPALMRAALIACLTSILSAGTAHAQSQEIEATGPLAHLHGTYLEAGSGAPTVIIVPGSGPTDRDGNNRLGVQAATYRLIAEGLAERGIASVRIDKRGMFGSTAAVKDPNDVTIADYAEDIRSWIGAIHTRTGNECIWLLGHSEGALVALAAAQRPDNICGLLLVAGPGRKLGDILRDQLRANPANAPYLPVMLAAINELEAGREVDTATMPPTVAPLFSPATQGFMRNLFAQDPAALIANVTLPVLILQGETDLQIATEDARLLAQANPRATLALLPSVNHVLKEAPADMGANLATYAHPNLPLAPGVIDAIAGFIGKHAR
ncbi:MAG: alpha/beta fold hydrolase [Mesorhizobium sp.]